LVVEKIKSNKKGDKDYVNEKDEKSKKIKSFLHILDKEKRERVMSHNFN